MKRDSPIRAMFGLTQQEMAALLGVSNSHYSMFESGKRDIPLASRQILNELLLHRRSSQPKAKPTSKDSAKANELQQKHLKRLLLENEYQSAKLSREIAAVERKKDKISGIKNLQDFLASGNKEDLAVAALARVPLARKHTKAANLDCDSILMKLHIKLELLEVERNHLVAKLK